ncbi:hypothetical protein [Xenorhabdus bovienii]|uniref:hypothetical protein n=1 Tax=Xenorhabdus bovienii TaxID=40576 RepID=UPI00237C6203|nr:hypothetical protein [Xenorhabdus bovienii]MDE1476541.1 hypothetical protein [Xenorhabdus bovienii]MDE9436408.1 hypothetical protein [Xenorhabdus bovienii]MDE9463487.1 hypothetical protein [Xenorhabdus bovienii]MDE9467551.1 hypothetical protein [Xenorhabdus bovienii]MDE9471026.1 hypothetical protein [Xenorhabdus bovienii]
MINKKISILAGLFLSLAAGTGMAAEKATTGQGVIAPSNFQCDKFMSSGYYMGKLDYVISIDNLNSTYYWFVSSEQDNQTGCVNVDESKVKHAKIIHDAFLQGKIVKIRLNGSVIERISF